MQINLKRNWFTSEAQLLEVRNNPITVPHGLEKEIPKDAEVLPEAKIEAPKPAEKK
jgi:hypothetical protein